MKSPWTESGSAASISPCPYSKASFFKPLFLSPAASLTAAVALDDPGQTDHVESDLPGEACKGHEAAVDARYGGDGFRVLLFQTAAVDDGRREAERALHPLFNE